VYNLEISDFVNVFVGCRVTSPLLLVAVLLSAGAAYAVLLKYAETRLIVVGGFFSYFCHYRNMFIFLEFSFFTVYPGNA